MEEPQAIPPWVQEKGVTLTSATPMSEEMAECIKAYLKYNTGCNYEYRKTIHYSKKGVDSKFRRAQPHRIVQ
ncbi:hypothetical protein GOBAR_AA34728 [Gossypium barbadense]|uniref:Uncharacterized protein n=1 Tax=Gossypium barbadense TaxID=3634 RepID=A0A2P5W4G0_GOSBA|nr:hypothetical protein GOBAR_AA34728 [Gossypium barbadense]